MTVLIHLNTFYGCFCITVVNSSSYNRDHMAHWDRHIYYVVP